MKRFFGTLCFALVWHVASCLAAGSGPDGWVVAVQGNWSRAGNQLRLYDPVSANDNLRGSSGKLEVALKDGQPPHVYRCHRPPCSIVIPGFRPAEDSLLARLGRAFAELASHRDMMPISAISRGGEHLRQAVLPLTGDRLNLENAVTSADEGAYIVSLRPIEVSGTQPKKLRGSLDWEPPASTTVTFPALAKGIYELTVSSSEGDSLGSVTVLVVNSAEYPAKQKQFDDAARSIAREADPATIEVLRNAILFQIESSSK